MRGLLQVAKSWRSLRTLRHHHQDEEQQQHDAIDHQQVLDDLVEHILPGCILRPSVYNMIAAIALHLQTTIDADAKKEQEEPLDQKQGPRSSHDKDENDTIATQDDDDDVDSQDGDDDATATAPSLLEWTI